MRKYCITILLVLFSLLELRPVLNAQVSSQPAFNVIFSEILLGTANSGTEEFIELFNNTNSQIDLSDWKIQYASSSSTNWNSPTRTINLNGIIQPKSYLLATSTSYPEELTTIKFSSTLSQSSGNLRIVHGDTNAPIVEDLIAWGSASLGLGDPALAPPASSSLNRFKDQDNNFNPTLNNIDDFVHSESLTPLTDNTLPVPEPEEEPVVSETEQTPEPATEPTIQESTQYYLIELTEIFPNPAEPINDSDGEFVEIFNPNPVEVELKGYKILAGLNGTYKHIFPEGQVIAPMSYMIISSSDTNLTLSNTAGLVKILDPEGEILSQTAEYQSAPEGQAYIITTNGWQWTSTPTPASANIFTAIPVSVKTTKKASQAKQPKSTKAKIAKVSAVKSASAESDNNQSQIQETSGQVNSKLLAGLGVLIVLYALYEYRTDLKNRIHQFRTYRKNRANTIKSH